MGELIPVPEGSEGSETVREAVRRRNLRYAQMIHEENRRLHEMIRAAGLDPQGAVDPLARRRDSAA